MMDDEDAPPSAGGAAGGAVRASREEYKKRRELEELRKAGIAQPAYDEEGKMINPHIPAYISKRPWYLGGSEAQGLKHQYKLGPEDEEDATPSAHQWYKSADVQQEDEEEADEEVSKPPPRKKFRKGACENCGALTHTKKECTDRPRARNARYGGRIVGSDEVLPKNVKLGFDAKRDRWGGFSSDQYASVLDRHKKAEQLRLQHLEETQEVVTDAAAGSDAQGIKGDQGAVFQKRDDGTRTTVRTLRIREDRAKYLRNLNPNSAHYDPKTRSMRENPHPEKDPSQLEYAGDNFVRFSGETKEVTELQLFAWEQWERNGGTTDDGTIVDPFANPSLTELVFKKRKEDQQKQIEEKKKQIFERYGGQEHLLTESSAADPNEAELIKKRKEQLLFQGGVDADMSLAPSIPKSKYEEDNYPLNHRSIWGSYYKEGKWGYSCCHQMIRGSYCTGEVGIKNEAARMT
eukprot:TRINITY_DN3348_c0_g1_i1.p1 TRINITY_DN3348_c0_g1~~TRINITY_DN3348_c0_g1_i1.p1  ORF type:complete len:461 (+),score=127.86 TRINITY_DN3348_c0_g1_i1:1414-2796(+)